MCIVLLSGFLMLEQGYSLFWLYPVGNPIDVPEVNAFFFGVHRLGCLLLAALVHTARGRRPLPSQDQGGSHPVSHVGPPERALTNE